MEDRNKVLALLGFCLRSRSFGAALLVSTRTHHPLYTDLRSGTASLPVNAA